jgi:phospholipid/cholesterol/gamma-HCH transport system substrate-binding protein
VLLSGVQVGTVKKITLAPDGKSVNIGLQIYQDFPIYHDARFVIESAGFLGDQYVSVIPTANTDPVLTNNQEVVCQEPFNLQEVARSTQGFIKRMDDTAAKLESSVADLRTQVLNAQTLSSFSASITNLQVFSAEAVQTMRNLDGIITTNRTEVTLALSNAVYFSQQLNQLAASAQDLLASNRVQIDLATHNLADSSASIKQVTGDLQAGHGLAGVILQDQALATNVQTLAANLAVTSSNLNRLGLWGILWSHKPPATNNPSATAKTR